MLNLSPHGIARRVGMWSGENANNPDRIPGVNHADKVSAFPPPVLPARAERRPPELADRAHVEGDGHAEGVS